MSTPEPPLDDGIDRIAPTRRPSGPALMYHRWWHLLFLHWPVPLEMLRPLVPAGLEIDTFAGRAYVGLIPFDMTGIRPRFLPPLPGLSRSLEVNARTYVHYQGRDPGVWFFSLDAAHALAVLVARRFFHLPYFHARMRMEFDRSDSARPTISYASERLNPGPRPARCALRYAPGDDTPTAARPGTLEHFLVERYILYAHHEGALYQGRVHHAPYPLQAATLQELDESLIAAAGITRPEEPPPLIHYARGVHVRIYPPRRVRP